MMHPHNRILFVVLVSALILAGCKEEQIFPVEPYIEYISFTKIQNSQGIDEKGILKLSFTDGDGDIGLSDDDTEPPFDSSSIYYSNFFITYFEKQKGEYKEIVVPIPFNSRIPIINPSGKSRSIRGELEIELYINNPFTVYDTIKFDCFIVDRALHHSNTISTPEIIVKKH